MRRSLACLLGFGPAGWAGSEGRRMVVSKISDESVQLFGSGQGVREDVTAQGARGKTIKSIHRAKNKKKKKKRI